MDISLLVFAAAIIGTIAGNLITARLAQAERIEARRKARLEFYISKLERLIEIRGKLEELNIKDLNDMLASDRYEFSKNHARLIGQASSTILAIDDPELRTIAIERLTPYLVDEANPEEFRKWGDFRNRNRNALTDAIIQLSKRIEQIS